MPPHPRVAARRRRRRIGWVSGAVAVAAAVAFGLPRYASANSDAPTSEAYVALGDSYSSGVGAPPYLDEADGSDCKRSERSYPAVLAARSDAIDSFTLAACSGAVTVDVRREQLAAVDRDTTLVTLTIGGNDVGFARVMTQCVLANVLPTDCRAAIDESAAVMRDELPARLETTYRAILDRAPKARLVVLGYPQLFDSGGTCDLVQSALNPSEEIRVEMNRAAVALNRTIRSAVADVGGKRIRFVDPREAFAGHGICGPDPFTNEPKDNLASIGDSYHPNVKGHAAYAEVLADRLW